MSQKLNSRDGSDQRGKLRIGNDWNAITIIALSQSNPLKAIAELVENSIDARATNVTIVRGRSEGRHYLEVRDNGQGIPRDPAGRPDFRYVATHICDSVKRRLKVEGAAGLQGEFGIGLLSFWTLGEEMTLTSTGREDPVVPGGGVARSYSPHRCAYYGDRQDRSEAVCSGATAVRRTSTASTA